MMDVGVEERLRTRLRSSAEAVTVPEDLPARVERRITVRRRQAMSARVAVAVLALGAMGGAVVVAGGDGGPTEVLPPAVGSPSEGMWEPLPEAPLSARFQHAAVWTGEEMIVFGGYDGGEGGEGGAAAYSPATGAWRRLADPPGDVERAPVAVWTGTELVAFGGEHDYATHGAIYDPDADEWRTVSEPTFGTANSTASHAVWTGDRVLVAGFLRQGEDEGGGAQGAALYDPTTDEWTRLPDAPEDMPMLSDAVWTGDELVLIGPEPGSGARAPQRMLALALDPATATWRALPAPPLDARAQALVAWSGQEVVVGGGHAFSESGVAGTERDAVAFDPVSGTWRVLPDAPTPFQGSERYVDVTVDGRVLALDAADSQGRVLVLDPAAGSWRLAPGPNRPALTEERELPGRRDAPAVSTGRSALVWGGGVARAESDTGSWGCCRAVGEGAIFTPPPAAAPPR